MKGQCKHPVEFIELEGENRFFCHKCNKPIHLYSKDEFIADVKKTIAHLKSIGVNPSYLVTSEKCKLSEEQKNEIMQIILNESPIPDISIENFNKNNP